MKQVLDALESSRVFVTTREKIKHPEGTEWYDNCITVLRQAIEAAKTEKQEPVAWVQDVEFEQLPEFAFSWVKTRLHDKPLYTHPPKREWVSLTDDQIKEIVGPYEGQIKGYTRALFDKIDAKLRENNG